MMSHASDTHINGELATLVLIVAVRCPTRSESVRGVTKANFSTQQQHAHTANVTNHQIHLHETPKLTNTTTQTNKHAKTPNVDKKNLLTLCFRQATTNYNNNTLQEPTINALHLRFEGTMSHAFFCSWKVLYRQGRKLSLNY
jgi:hypothetical protein